MKILVLSPYPERVTFALRQEGDDPTVFNGPPDQWPNEEFDFVVTYGYRYIIKEPLLTRYRMRIANIHISYLPWNRGTNPNFWSWYDDTPKGVSLHFVDSGVDTGPIIARMEATDFSPNSTHKSSYDYLHFLAGLLFLRTWPVLRTGSWNEIIDNNWKDSGSFHTHREFADVLGGAKIDPEMPVSEIARMGCGARKQ
jgi:methionyl-tRNA formyltransferase